MKLLETASEGLAEPLDPAAAVRVAASVISYDFPAGRPLRLRQRPCEARRGARCHDTQQPDYQPPRGS